jgi:hypothetical protein
MHWGNKIKPEQILECQLVVINKKEGKVNVLPMCYDTIKGWLFVKEEGVDIMVKEGMRDLVKATFKLREFLGKTEEKALRRDDTNNQDISNSKESNNPKN